MIEAVAALALFGTLAVLVIPMVTAAASVREDAAQRQIAVQELGNAMERLAAVRTIRPLTEADVAAVALSPAATLELPNVRLDRELVPDETDSGTWRLMLALTWDNAAGQRAAPVSVTTFLTTAEDSQ